MEGVFLTHRSCGNSALSDPHRALDIEWTKQAKADLAKVAKREADRIQRAVVRFAGDQQGDIERLQRGGSQRHRLRVGDYRVIFRREDEYIQVRRVLHRREAYRKSARAYQDVLTADGGAEANALETLAAPSDQEEAPQGGRRFGFHRGDAREHQSRECD